MYSRVLLLIFLTLLNVPLRAQQSASFLQSIKTVQVIVNGVWDAPPVMAMGGGNTVQISFDDLQHDYVRYTYRISHCDADWQKSDIFEGDYMDGLNGVNRLENYTQSMNTETEYNHYTLTLPNKDVRLLISGNYLVEFFEDGDEEPVAQACFSLLEPRVGIDVTVSGNTDIDTRKNHQQLSFKLNFPNYGVVNPEEEFKPVVIQNRRWDTHVSGIKPTYIRTNQFEYSFNRKLIFTAGNEYRRFEIIDRRVPMMNVDRIYRERGDYHAQLYPDKPRKNYLYDQDQDGRYLIRNEYDAEIDTESEYIHTHFTLVSPRLPGGEVYLNGNLTDNSYDAYYQMEYNDVARQYEITLPLKQGSYNYQYLVVDEDGIGHTELTEGDFYQTENEYHVYIYHRAFGERYDRLVGFQKCTPSN